MKEIVSSDPKTYAIIGAAMDVHSVLGFGFLERVYQQALAVEFDARGIPYRQEADISVLYKGTALACAYRADFICFEEVLIELKATATIDKTHVSQVINYLNATGLRRGLLFNFGSEKLEYKRLVH